MVACQVTYVHTFSVFLAIESVIIMYINMYMTNHLPTYVLIYELKTQRWVIIRIYNIKGCGYVQYVHTYIGLGIDAVK